MKLDYRHIMLLCAVVVGVLTSGGVRAEEPATLTMRHCSRWAEMVYPVDMM